MAAADRCRGLRPRGLHRTVQQQGAVDSGGHPGAQPGRGLGDETGPGRPLCRPASKSSQLFQYSLREAHGHRMKVRGVVTFQEPGQALFIADVDPGPLHSDRAKHPGATRRRSGGAGISCHRGIRHRRGCRTRYSRKSEPGRRCPRLRSIRQTGRATPTMPLWCKWKRSCFNRARHVREQILELQSGSVVFDAYLDAAQVRRICWLYPGWQPRPGYWHLPGPGRLEYAVSQRPQAFSLLLRSAAEVKLLERPSWWTVPHTLWVLAATLAVFCASLAWVAMLRQPGQSPDQDYPAKGPTRGCPRGAHSDRPRPAR